MIEPSNFKTRLVIFAAICWFASCSAPAPSPAPEPQPEIAAEDAGGVKDAATSAPKGPRFVVKPDTGPPTSRWNQWGGSSLRNNTPVGRNIPHEWNVGGIDPNTGRWQRETAKNIKWVARLGSETYGNPVIVGGRVFIGTNNSRAYLKRYPGQIDLGCLLALRESDGGFLWQHSSEKLATGNDHDWALQGICSTPLVEGDRLWFVTSRGEVRCLDTEGFYDGQDDGPVKDEWGRLFDEKIDVAAGLDANNASDALKALCGDAGVELSGFYSVRRVVKSKEWLVTTRTNDVEKKIQVTLDGGTIRLRPVDDGAGRAREREAFLNAGLDDGRISATLRVLCGRRGFSLPDGAPLSVDAPGRQWSGSAKIDGQDRKFRFELAGGRLSGFKLITPDDKHEADTVWVLDMMGALGVRQHNMAACSVTGRGDVLFVCTGNGVDESHEKIPAPDAPSFLALDKKTGKVLWADASPGKNILHGDWGSPAVAVLGGVPQAIFPGADGWLYSFHADKTAGGKPELLWRFDCNPKTSQWVADGSGDRSIIIATPVVHDGLVYIAVGEDPELDTRDGRVWCIDPTRRGDVSSQLAFAARDAKTPLPMRRVRAVIPEKGEVALANPNSAVVWHYEKADRDLDGDGQIEYRETMYRSIGTATVKAGLLLIADLTGLVHCVDAKTGRVHWTHDLSDPVWGSPLIVDGKVYIGDTTGKVTVFRLSPEEELLATNEMPGPVRSTPIVVNNVLYIATRMRLFAIEKDKRE